MMGETDAARAGVDATGRSAAARPGQGVRPVAAEVDARPGQGVRPVAARVDAQPERIHVEPAPRNATEPRIRVEIPPPATETAHVEKIVIAPADINGHTGGQGAGGNNSSYNSDEEAQREAEDIKARVADIEKYLRAIHETHKALLAENMEQAEQLTELQEQVRDLSRTVNAIAEDLAAQHAVSSNLLAIALLREQTAQTVARDAAGDGDNQMREVMERAFTKLGWVGDKLLSLNLHLMPVKQWEIGGELSVAGVMKGSFTVTFGHE